jgi:hypothetical protein
VAYFCGPKLGALSFAKQFTIEGKFPGRPANCVFKTIVFLQLWRPLQKSKALPQLDGVVAKLKETLASLNS